MKRDMELVRKLLFFFDEKEDAAHVKMPPIEGYDEHAIGYHLVLMFQANLLQCEPTTTKTGRIISVLPFELTWDGHEFLDKIRNDSVWKKVRDTVAAKGGSLAFAVVSRLAAQYATEMIES